jgi:hypothetical protein
MTELTHSVRAHLVAVCVAALLLLGLIAIGAVTGTGAVSQGFSHAVHTDGPLMHDLLLRVKRVDDEETGLRGYLLTHAVSFLAPYTTARRILPIVRTRTLLHSVGLPGVRPLFVSMGQRGVAWERWAQQLLPHPPAGHPQPLPASHNRGKASGCLMRGASPQIASSATSMQTRTLTSRRACVPPRR